MDNHAIKVRAVIRCRYRPVRAGEEQPPHDHPFYQMICVVAGKSQFLLGDTLYDATEGDIFFLPPGVPHDLRSTYGILTTYETKFDVSEELAVLLSAVPLKLSGGRSRIRELMRLAVEEGMERLPHHRELITLSIESALYLLSRSHLPAGGAHTSAPVTNDAAVEQVLRYLALHLDERITLASLAAHFSFSREYLCRRFTAQIGVSPIRYLNDLRVERSRELLVETDMTVTEIAEALGYSGIHYFSRAFKRKMGISPQGYRDQRKNALCIRLDET